MVKVKRLQSEAAIRGVLYKKVFLKIFQNSQESTCTRVFFLIKLQALAYNFIKKETLAQVFCCEFYEISKNTFFKEHLRKTVSVTVHAFNPSQANSPSLSHP